jgi:hypothetical protein
MVQRIGSSAGIRGVKTPLFRPSEHRIGISHVMPVHCHVWLRVTGSRSATGPQVTMFATLALSAIHVRVTHRAAPGASGSQPDEISLTLPLVPANEQISRPSRTLRGPAGGSWMSLQLFDHERTALTEERELGACSDGIREASLPLVATVHPAAWLSSRRGREGADTMLRLDSELVFFSGIGVRLRLRPHSSTGDVVAVDISLASMGTTLHLADRLVELDVPGLPAILLVFLDADLQPIGRERLAHLRDL